MCTLAFGQHSSRFRVDIMLVELAHRRLRCRLLAPAPRRMRPSIVRKLLVEGALDKLLLHTHRPSPLYRARAKMGAAKLL